MAARKDPSTENPAWVPAELPSPEPSETELFESAMAGVKPLQAPKTVPRRNGAQRRGQREDRPADDSQLLSAFIDGKIEFEWQFHPGYQEGGPEQANRPLIRKLRRGAYSVQAELDLHGLTQAEAWEAMERFLDRCFQRSVRCVRIIHGKGNNSANQVGVLKSSVPRWLSMNRNAKRILAFTSAPPRDGGIGATYVLLRKRPTTRTGE